MEELQALALRRSVLPMAQVRKWRATAVTVMSNIVQGSSTRERCKGFLAHRPKPGPSWGLRTALMALALVFREKDRGE